MEAETVQRKAGRPRGTGTGRKSAIHVTLEPEQIAYLEKRGEGNVSAGVRVVTEEAMKRRQRAGQ